MKEKKSEKRVNREKEVEEKRVGEKERKRR